MNTDITTIAVGFYFGTVLAQFFTSFTRDLITPILAGVLPGAQQTLDKVVISVGSVKLDVGNVISSTLNLVIAYLVVSTTLPYIRTYTPLGGRR
jgi:large-conductance mechanosensitive channel